MKFVIANSSHRESVSQLVNSAYRGGSSKKGWTTEADLLGGQRTDPGSILKIIQQPKSVIILFINKDEIQGCVNLVAEGKKCYLGMLSVKPDLQAAGIGKKLMIQAEIWAKDYKCELIYMTVITLRTELIAWYERHGFKQTGELADFPYGDEKFGIPKVLDLQFAVLQKRL